MATTPDQPYNLTRYWRYVLVPLVVISLVWILFVIYTLTENQKIPFLYFNPLPQPTAPAAAVVDWAAPRAAASAAAAKV
jgi:hypothetical protein